jgi:molybdate transport system substrate-binding protein
VKKLASLLLLAPLALAACGSDSDEGPDRDLTVLAAASLTDVFTELEVGFEEKYDADVTFAFGSSADLAEQAADGAPGDVLATADEMSMQAVIDAGAAGPVEIFASNVMVIVVPAGNPAGIRSLDDLDGTTWVRCADEVPCGRVATSVLGANLIEAEPASLEDDVRATLDKVTSGEAEAGLVYATDAVAAGDAVETIQIPGAVLQQTSYFATALEQSRDAELAEAWIDYLTSREGVAVLDKAGFQQP